MKVVFLSILLWGSVSMADNVVLKTEEGVPSVVKDSSLISHIHLSPTLDSLSLQLCSKGVLVSFKNEELKQVFSDDPDFATFYVDKKYFYMTVKKTLEKEKPIETVVRVVTQNDEAVTIAVTATLECKAGMVSTLYVSTGLEK